MTKLIFYVNGQFVSENEAKISVLDLGFVRGYGVFDFLRTYQGKPFKLDEHLKRLQNSAKQIGLPIPPISQIRQIVLETLKKNALPEAGVKIVMTGGETNDGMTPAGKPTLAIIVKPLVSFPKDFYENGVKVITVDLSRELPEVKSTNYILAIMAKDLAKKENAVETLYKNKKGEILEGTQTNFFGFKGKNLITAEEGILKGITREIVLEIAEKEFPIKLRPIKNSELKTFNEAFITSTTKEIMPVFKIDDIIVSNGQVGSNTKRLMKLFRKYTQ